MRTEREESKKCEHRKIYRMPLFFSVVMFYFSVAQKLSPSFINFRRHFRSNKK